MLRAVLDTNVLVAAVLSPSGTPARIVRACADGEFDAVASPALLAELRGVLARDKIARIVPSSDAEAFSEWFAGIALSTPDPETADPVSPDPSDDYLVALARAVDAPLLVSGDAHLLGLTITRPRVVSPTVFAEFLDALR